MIPIITPLLLILIFITGCQKTTPPEYNWASKIKLNSKDVQQLESEFENKINSGKEYQNLKYVEVAVRYHDKRVLPFAYWLLEIGNTHLKCTALRIIGQAGSNIDLPKIKNYIQHENIDIAQYSKSAIEQIKKLQSKNNYFKHLPILDSFKKEPFLYNATASSIEGITRRILWNENSTLEF